MKKKIIILCVFHYFAMLQVICAQSKFSLTPGVFYNGNGFTEDVNGFGMTVGLEYMPAKNHVFSIELRTKYGYYNFDDGTGWRTDKDGDPLPPKNPSEARLKYDLFSPQVGIAPKLHLHFGESFALFLENEFAGGLMAGHFKYKGIQKKSRFTEPVFCYNIGVGFTYKLEKCILTGSIGYSTLNFRSKVKKHQPPGYQEHIPNQDAVLLVNIGFKIPL